MESLNLSRAHTLTFFQKIHQIFWYLKMLRSVLSWRRGFECERRTKNLPCAKSISWFFVQLRTSFPLRSTASRQNWAKHFEIPKVLSNLFEKSERVRVALGFVKLGLIEWNRAQRAEIRGVISDFAWVRQVPYPSHPINMRSLLVDDSQIPHIPNF